MIWDLCKHGKGSRCSQSDIEERGAETPEVLRVRKLKQSPFNYSWIITTIHLPIGKLTG